MSKYSGKGKTIETIKRCVAAGQEGDLNRQSTEEF